MLIWNGTTWVIPNAPAQNPTGLELITTGTFSNVSAADSPNCFSSLYDNYRICINVYSQVTGGRYGHLQLSTSGTPTTSGYYSKGIWWDIAGAGSTAVDFDIQTTKFCLGAIGYLNTGEGSYIVDLHSPFLNKPTRFNSNGTGLMAGSYFTSSVAGGLQTSTTSFNSFRITGNSDNISGNYSVYGYRKS